MKQQLIDRNECIAQINTLIASLEEQFMLDASNGDIDPRTIRQISNSRYIRSEIVAKMPIVEEREEEE